MVSPLKTLFALVVVLALISFVCTDVAYAIEIKPEVKGIYFEPTPDPKPPKIERPKAIMPEDPLRLEQDSESDEDANKQSGHKNHKDAPTAKREYHRRMMQR